MNVAMCPDCYSVYYSSLLTHSENGTKTWCPNASCGSSKVFDIDELMIPSIIKLNKKGYITTDCCSGHMYLPEMYVAFRGHLDLPMDTLPNYFKITHDTSIIFESQNNPDDNIMEEATIITGFLNEVPLCDQNIDKRYLIIHDAIKLFNEWVDKLPSIK